VEVRQCRQCDEWTDHGVRLEGDVALTNLGGVSSMEGYKQNRNDPD